MYKVKPKKSLGQHFLRDRSVAGKTAGLLTGEGYESVLEIGPGTGVLTGFLIDRNFRDFRVIEIDLESVEYLRTQFPGLYIITGDFLRMEIDRVFPGKLAIIGNFPYNISSQILFRVLRYRSRVTEVAGMFQKEVAERICSAPGSKSYGILSVLVQAFYTTQYLFTVSENLFSPPPKVKSAVIFLRRNENQRLDCNEELFFTVVKACFNQRRKTLRNSVKSAFSLKSYDYPEFNLRPEQLSVKQFADLTNWIEKNQEGK
jgi:16S rRNA (adenine1518-N6/adenine1519-N6)-dimethyltransferase